MRGPRKRPLFGRDRFLPGRCTLGVEVRRVPRIRQYDRRLETLCEEHYLQTELLRQVEGIGPLTALTFVLTMGHPHRFEKRRSVGAYVGLVPTRDQSGERNPREKRIIRRRETRS